MQSRRAIITTITSLLATGCLSSPTDPYESKSVVANVSQVEPAKLDGTKSSLGYIKFIETAEDNTVTIEQSVKIPGNPCQSVNMDVKPNSGPTNNDSISVDISIANSGPNVACPSVLPGNYPKPSAITINFKSLTSGQTITVSFGDEDDVSVSYTTKGENNTATREPFDVPPPIRVG